MMKYPIGIQSFDQIIEDGYVYIDKTALVYSLVNEGKIYFLSRPRRFGKSLLLSTLKNYFLGRKELFKGLAIDALEKDWLEYPVFHIDFNGKDFTKKDSLKEALDGYISRWEAEYGIVPDKDFDIGWRFSILLKVAHKQTGRRAVVLVDGYEKPVLDLLDIDTEVIVGCNRRLLKDHNRYILRGFYSVFKAADEHLHFVFVMGVTKFLQADIFDSGFNQPSHLCTHSRYAALCGFTQEEVENCFAEPIARLAEKYRCDVPQMKQLLKRQYGGYHFSPCPVEVYNPYSLLHAFDSMAVRDYWFKSSIPSYLLRRLEHTKLNPDELTDGHYGCSQSVDYRQGTDKLLPMIYQNGCLTIKEYDWTFHTCLLDFPNDEVKNGFLTLVDTDSLKVEPDADN